MRISETPDTLQQGALAHLRHRGEPAGELSDYLVLERAQLGEVELRLAKRDAVVGEIARGVHDGRGMQERLRGNAADVEAHAAQRWIALDQHRLQPEVRGAKRRRIAARPGAQDDDVAFEIR